MGRTVLALITPLICCRCFSKAEDETINFMNRDFGTKLLIFLVEPEWNIGG